MKITRYVHSCLLVETPQRVAIIDPGEYSWASGLFDVAKLKSLDDIIITHEHADHFHLPFIQALRTAFPQSFITTTPIVAEELAKRGFNNIRTVSSEGLEVVQVEHESMTPLAPPPNPDLVVHYLGKLTHPGDSHHFLESKEVLALPVNAPWGTWRRAAELGTQLRPKRIIPIHDWHLNEAARDGLYDRLEAFFGQNGITFLKIKDGETIEV